MLDFNSASDCYFCGEPLDDPELQNESILSDARELWAVRVLDAWRKGGIRRRWFMTEGISSSAPLCELTCDSKADRSFGGEDEAGARLSAADVVWVDLPESIQTRIGAKP
jgi:hypothetical protein